MSIEGAAQHNFDLVVIGAGSGGVRCARIASSLGARVAIVEGRFFGGTCVNVGCVPKKLFAYGSDLAEIPTLAADYGLKFPHVAPDWGVLKNNKDREIGRLNSIYEKLLDNAGVTIFQGYGKVVAPGQVQVGDQRLVADHVVLATGSKPFVPDIPGVEHCWISDHLFAMEKLPETVAVVGGGYIACEFASILAGMGCEVHQMYRGELFLRGFDDDVRHFVARQMRAAGVSVHFNTDVTAVNRQGKQKELLLAGEGAPDSALLVDQVIMATGRVPNIDGLFADGVAPELSVNGAVVVDAGFRSSMDGLYAIGDLIDRMQLTPMALAEGMWLARDLFGKGVPPSGQPPSYDLVPTAVFCHPNIGTVGLTEAQALERHGRLRVYTSEFTPMRYSLGRHYQRSYMKLVVDDASDEVVGLHVVGDEAAEITQGFAVAMRCGATKADFDSTIGIHPSAAEELVTMREGRVVESQGQNAST